MNKGTFAFLYVIISSIINIVYSLIVGAVVVAISMLMMKHVFHARPEIYPNALSCSFLIGLVIAFFTYSKISMKIIKKYKLEERISKGTSPKKNKSTEEPKKTVIPSSLVEDEEDEKWRE